MNDKTGRAYPHGKSVAPLYTEAPDQQPGFRAKPWWLMVQEHAVEKEFAANDWALERLKHGASGLLFTSTITNTCRAFFAILTCVTFI